MKNPLEDPRGLLRQAVLLFSLLLTLIATMSHADQEPPILRHNIAAGRHSAVVFMYHHFGVSQYPETNVSLDQFESHLEHLQQQGYSVWPLQDIITSLEQGKPLPDRTVAITVDDAYISVYTEAWPRLRQRGWPFTVFVSTDAVDRKLPAFMNWEQMREMQQHGASFANHSRSHDYLIKHQQGEDDKIWSARIRADISFAQQRLQQELGSAPMLFAYPYGEYTLPLKTLIREMGYTAFTQQSGAISFDNNSDPQLLPRFPMAASFANIDVFRTKAATLPLPVSATTPAEPVTFERQPTLTITLNRDKTSARTKQQINCFVSGQGQTAIHWLDTSRYTITAAKPLPPGRNRYNCTAPSTQSGRYYWFSQLWIVQEDYSENSSGKR